MTMTEIIMIMDKATEDEERREDYDGLVGSRFGNNVWVCKCKWVNE